VTASVSPERGRLIVEGAARSAAALERRCNARVARSPYRVYRRSDGELLAGYGDRMVARRAMREFWGGRCELRGELA